MTSRFLAALFTTVVAFTGTTAASRPQGDAARGAQIYERCIACHALKRNRTGPKHCGIFGRRAGGVAGFDYSDAMAASGTVWDSESLDRFLEAPMDAVPGTSMGYDGVKVPQDRADLIAYLQSATADSPLCR